MSTRRHSIQRQIVGPVTGMLALTVTLVSLLCAYLSTRELERSLALQIERISRIMRESSFPLSVNVLARMREISGAHFIVWDKVGRIGATTFEDVDLVEQLRPHLHTHVGKGNISDRPAVRLVGELYFVKVARHDFPSQESVMILYPRSELTSAQWRAIALPLLVGLGGVVAMMLVMRSVSIRLTHRLEEVHNRVADIAEGDFREIPAENVPDEIGDLISSVNDMARRIRSMHELIGRTERSRVLGQLAGGLAHQMRNALTGTRLAIQIHERRCLTAKEEESLAVALQQLSVMEEHMKRLLSVG
ncbi:MAG: HAMP domain-containing protein, partial [Planctomycetaceae bacterium]|nr:HAMP domain-containing protein [Planctomycetaceae bacterium]